MIEDYSANTSATAPGGYRFCGHSNNEILAEGNSPHCVANPCCVIDKTHTKKYNLGEYNYQWNFKNSPYDQLCDLDCTCHERDENDAQIAVQTTNPGYSGIPFDCKCNNCKYITLPSNNEGNGGYEERCLWDQDCCGDEPVRVYYDTNELQSNGE